MSPSRTSFNATDEGGGRRRFHPRRQLPSIVDDGFAIAGFKWRNDDGGRCDVSGDAPDEVVGTILIHEDRERAIKHFMAFVSGGIRIRRPWCFGGSLVTYWNSLNLDLRKIEIDSSIWREEFKIEIDSSIWREEIQNRNRLLDLAERQHNQFPPTADSRLRS